MIADAEDTALAPPSLDFLSEPTVIVTLSGEVLTANAAARQRFDLGAMPCPVDRILADPPDQTRALLRRASGSTSFQIAAATARGSADGTEGEERVRAFAARFDQGEGRVILRLVPAQDHRFAALNRQLVEMDRLLKDRMRENAELQQALAENRLLLQELQHRVKNNIQQMLGLIRLSADRTPVPDLDAVIQAAGDRLRAMSVTQEAIYRDARIGAIPARAFLPEVAEAAAASHGAADALTLSVGEGVLSSDEGHALALIANELLTNAFRHGLAGSGTTVRVTFGPDAAGGYELVVADDGPGYDPVRIGRSSGLALARRLSRQIDGTLHIENDGGTVCTVRFGQGKEGRG